MRAAMKAYLDASDRGDAASLLNMWTAEGDFIDASGARFNAREMLKESSAAAGSTPRAEGSNPRAEPSATSLRFVAPNVAIEDGATGEVALSDGRVMQGRFTAIWVNQGGKWLLDGLRESVVEAPALDKRLAPLAWMLGEWVGANGDTEILVSAHPSDAGKYLVREFLVRRPGGESMTGAQRIGWDPVKKQLKAWTFDSQGGAGEGVWRREGDQWVLEVKHTMPNGVTVTMDNAYQALGDDQFLWTVQPQSIDGQEVAPTKIEFNRASE